MKTFCSFLGYCFKIFLGEEHILRCCFVFLFRWLLCRKKFCCQKIDLFKYFFQSFEFFSGWWCAKPRWDNRKKWSWGNFRILQWNVGKNRDFLLLFSVCKIYMLYATAARYNTILSRFNCNSHTRWEEIILKYIKSPAFRLLWWWWWLKVTL